MTGTPDPEAILALAGVLARESGALIRRYFRADFLVETKADQTPVTIADREAELLLRRLIGEAFPHHGIIGEEFGAERADAPFVWVLDPIDGTRAFMTGMPTFGTLVALLRGDEPWFGMINQPISGECWMGGAGGPTTLNGRPARVSGRHDLAASSLYATTPDMFAGTDSVRFGRLYGAVRTPRYGADCYAYGLLASGHVDLVCEASMGLHDFAALAPVVEGAGGIITDWRGERLRRGSDGRVLAAASAALHRQALEIIAA